MKLAAPAVVLLLGSACASDHGIGGLCGTPQQGFDITEASVLQDGQARPGLHDAVILDFDSELPEGAGWRVRSVEIMPLLPAFSFDSYPDGQTVTVEVWDAADPHGTPYTVTQTFDKSEHDWQTVTLSNPDEATPGDHQSAWWRFGFEDVIPTSGMSASQYLVGITWQSGDPPMGYSNYDLACDRNWSDYDDGLGWILNEGAFSPNSCSWPMLRVNLEVLETALECEGVTYQVEE